MARSIPPNCGVADLAAATLPNSRRNLLFQCRSLWHDDKRGQEMRRLGLLLLAVLFAAMAATTGFAADRSASVQAEVEQALARLARLDPAQGFSYGAVEIVPEDSAYGVTVADVAMKLAANDPGILDIGIVSFRLSPVGADAYRVDRLATVNGFAHRGADGQVDGVWQVVPRRLSGLWSRSQGGFLRRGATVDIGLAITGLDTAVSAVASAPPQPGSNLGWLQLMLLRGLARREAAADGVVIDRYDISAAAGRPIVVNGQAFDLSAAALSVP
jgi:hypothetical protein